MLGIKLRSSARAVDSAFYFRALSPATPFRYFSVVFNYMYTCVFEYRFVHMTTVPVEARGEGIGPLDLELQLVYYEIVHKIAGN